MKKRNLILYLIIIALVLIGAGLAILINYLNGIDLATMLTSKEAITIEVAIGVFLTIVVALLIFEWGRGRR